MIETFSFSTYPAIDRPRRMKMYVLIWCRQGTATLVVDEKELPVRANEVLTITSGQVHYFKKQDHAEGTILEFPLYFFCKDDHDIELIFHNGLFCHFAQNEVIAVPQHAVMETQLELIREELQQKPYQYLLSIHSRIKLILITINRAKVERGDEIWKPDALFLKFLELVRESFEQNYSLSQLAEKLGTTEARLNEQSKLHTGKTAQNVIYGLITSEAKRLLTYQDISVKEVAYKLGFSDPFYFSNFFKRHTLQSPKSYRDSYTL